MDLNDLLAARRELAAKLSNLEDMRRPLQAELEQVERELFERISFVAGALQGAVPKPLVMPPLVGVKWPAKAWPVPPGIGGDERAPAATSAATAAIASSFTRIAEASGKLMPQILEALRAIGRPATRNEIFEHLVLKGVPVPGKDPKANLSAHLSYSDDFARTEDGRWYIKQPDLINPHAADGQPERQTPPEGGV